MWRKSSHNFRGAIRRTVIDYKYFAFGDREVLRDDAVDRLLDQTLVIVRVDEYAKLHFDCSACPKTFDSLLKEMSRRPRENKAGRVAEQHCQLERAADKWKT